MQKNNDSFATETEIREHIKSKNFSPCYVIFGEEHYVIKRHLASITSAAVENFPEFNLLKFDGQVKAQSIYDAVCSLPMMSDRKVVTLCDFPFDKAPAAETDKIFSAIEELQNNPSTVFVMWFETIEIPIKKTPEKFTKLFKEVKKIGGTVAYIGRKSQPDIIRMLQSGAARRKCRLDSNVARYMIETCSDDLGTLVNELEKLCFYVGENGVITTDTVNTICSRSTEATVYNVSKAVLRGDVESAYAILDDLFFMNTEAAYILTFLSSAYMDIYRAFSARSAGLRPETIAKDLGYFSTSFRLTEGDRKLNLLSENQIVRSLKVLSDCDKAVKSSRTDGRILIEKTIAELALIARGNS